MILGCVRTPEMKTPERCRALPRRILVSKILAGRLIIRVLQLFEVVQGPRRPHISILGLMLNLEIFEPCHTKTCLTSPPILLFIWQQRCQKSLQW